jgi:hypothetical protein
VAQGERSTASRSRGPLPDERRPVRLDGGRLITFSTGCTTKPSSLWHVGITGTLISWVLGRASKEVRNASCSRPALSSRQVNDRQTGCLVNSVMMNRGSAADEFGFDRHPDLANGRDRLPKTSRWRSRKTGWRALLTHYVVSWIATRSTSPYQTEEAGVQRRASRPVPWPVF